MAEERSCANCVNAWRDCTVPVLLADEMGQDNGRSYASVRKLVCDNWVLCEDEGAEERRQTMGRQPREE